MGFLIKVADQTLEEMRVFLDIAVDEIIEGKIIAFPTDSVYGLGCDPTNLNAVQRLFNIKFRDQSKGFLLLIYNVEEAQKVAQLNSSADKLIRGFWPGELTLILKRRPDCIIPPEVTGSEETIGLRVPKNEIILEILKRLKEKGHFGGIVGTSANYAGEEPSIDGQEVAKKLLTPVDIIIDGGKTKSQIPTTIVDCSKEEIEILREGKITKEQIDEVLK
ncbi:MAG: Threonylcarbamoyl-AMP synthase [Promethearchaeota archaeon]|nr:MAG: Threonylcarbamoyl-AMP synthase [Candidatus Lokiarchaeota archaeon]